MPEMTPAEAWAAKFPPAAPESDDSPAAKWATKFNLPKDPSITHQEHLEAVGNAVADLHATAAQLQQKLNPVPIPGMLDNTTPDPRGLVERTIERDKDAAASIAGGLAQVRDAGNREKSLAGGEPGPTGGEIVAGGLHHAIGGAMTLAEPLMGAGLAAAPLATAATVGGGMLAQEGTTAGLSKLGVSKPYAELAGDVAGLAVGAKAHSMFDGVDSLAVKAWKSKFGAKTVEVPDVEGSSTNTGETAGTKQAAAPAEQPAAVRDEAKPRTRTQSPFGSNERVQAKAEVAAEPGKLPADIAGAKPRYSYGKNQFDVKLDDDVDRASWITSQKTPSKQDAKYLKFVMDETGWTEEQVREHGSKVREAVKQAAVERMNQPPLTDEAGNPISRGPLKVGRQRPTEEAIVDDAEESEAAKPNMVRMYHGADAASLPIDEARWFSSDRKYAEGYASKSANPKVVYVDIPENHPLIEPEWADQTIARGFHQNVELPAEISKTAREVAPAQAPTDKPSSPAQNLRDLIDAANRTLGKKATGAEDGEEVTVNSLAEMIKRLSQRKIESEVVADEAAAGKQAKVEAPVEPTVAPVEKPVRVKAAPKPKAVEAVPEEVPTSESFEEPEAPKPAESAPVDEALVRKRPLLDDDGEPLKTKAGKIREREFGTKIDLEQQPEIAKALDEKAAARATVKGEAPEARSATMRDHVVKLNGSIAKGEPVHAVYDSSKVDHEGLIDPAAREAEHQARVDDPTRSQSAQKSFVPESYSRSAGGDVLVHGTSLDKWMSNGEKLQAMAADAKLRTPYAPESAGVEMALDLRKPFDKLPKVKQNFWELARQGSPGSVFQKALEKRGVDPIDKLEQVKETLRLDRIEKILGADEEPGVDAIRASAKTGTLKTPVDKLTPMVKAAKAKASAKAEAPEVDLEAQLKASIEQAQAKKAGEKLYHSVSDPESLLNIGADKKLFPGGYDPERVPGEKLPGLSFADDAKASAKYGPVTFEFNKGEVPGLHKLGAPYEYRTDSALDVGSIKAIKVNKALSPEHAAIVEDFAKQHNIPLDAGPQKRKLAPRKSPPLDNLLEKPKPNPERGSAPILMDVAQKIKDKLDGPDVGLEQNYSGVGSAETKLVRNLGQVKRAAPEVVAPLLRAASPNAQATVKMMIAAPKIEKALGSDLSIGDFKRVMIQDRLNAIRDTWDAWAKDAESLDDNKLVAGLKKGVNGLLWAMEDKNGLPGNLVETAGALAEAEDYKGLRSFLSDTFSQASKSVRDVMSPDDFVEHSNKPGFQKGLDVYKAELEPMLEEGQAKRDGAFSTTKGEFDTYYPLEPLMPKDKAALAEWNQKEARPNPFKELLNQQAGKSELGLSGEYDPASKVLKDRLSEAFRSKDKAAAIDALVSADVMRELPQGSEPGRAYDYNGVPLKSTTMQIGFRHFVAPEAFARELKPILDPQGEKASPGAIEKVMSALNTVAVTGLAEPVYHSYNIMGTLISRVPFIGKTLGRTAGEVPFVRPFYWLTKLASTESIMGDHIGPENISALQWLAEHGALGERYGTATRSRALAEITGGEVHRYSLGPSLYGPKGIDMRARIEMYKASQLLDPKASVKDRVEFVNQLGQYTKALQGEVERAIKTTGLSPFYTAGSTMLRNGIANWTNSGPKLGQRSAAAQVAHMLTKGAVGTVSLWALTYKSYTGKWPWEDSRSKLLQIPVNSKDRYSKVGKMMWGTGPEQGYLNFGFFNPLIGRGARALGVSGAYESHVLGGSKEQMADAAERDALNSFTHPIMGPVAKALFTGATGNEPYLTGLRDDRGKMAPQLWNVTHSGGVAARAGAAMKELNSFYGNLGAATGMLSTEREVKGNQWLRMVVDLAMPGAVGKPSDPYRKQQFVEKQKRGMERAQEKERK